MDETHKIRACLHLPPGGGGGFRGTESKAKGLPLQAKGLTIVGRKHARREPVNYADFGVSIPDELEQDEWSLHGGEDGGRPTFDFGRRDHRP